MRRLFVIALLLVLAPFNAVAQVSLEALIEAALTPRLGANLPEAARLEIQLPPDAPAKAAYLTALEYDRSSSTFTATAQHSDGTQSRTRGHVAAVVDLLVPNRAIAPGEITRAADFSVRTLPAQTYGRFVLSHPDQIIGREVRRVLAEGRPVQAQSLQEPRIIKRGDRVELLYNRGALSLSTPARALDDAAEGETLRVQNLNSNRTVNATAKGEGQVMVLQ